MHHPTEPTWSYQLAQGVAYLASPVVFPPFLFGSVLVYFDAPAQEVGWILALTLLFFVIVPVGYALWMVHRGLAASLEMADRRVRTRLFGAGIASYLTGLALAYVVGRTATALVTALMACYAINTLLVLLVNMHWKISAHVAASAGFISMLFFIQQQAWQAAAGPLPVIQPALLYGFFLLVPLLMWARVRTQSHTRGQVVAGAALGLLAPYLELHLFDSLGAFAGVW